MVPSDAAKQMSHDFLRYDLNPKDEGSVKRTITLISEFSKFVT